MMMIICCKGISSDEKELREKGLQLLNEKRFNEALQHFEKAIVSAVS